MVKLLYFILNNNLGKIRKCSAEPLLGIPPHFLHIYLPSRATYLLLFFPFPYYFLYAIILWHLKTKQPDDFTFSSFSRFHLFPHLFCGFIFKYLLCSSLFGWMDDSTHRGVCSQVWVEREKWLQVQSHLWPRYCDFVCFRKLSWWACLMHCRMIRSMCGFYPLDIIRVSNTIL